MGKIHNTYHSVSNRESIARSAVYVLMCGILFALPEIILSIRRPSFPVIYARPIMCVIIFAANYFYLIDKFFYNRSQVWKYVLINFILVGLATSIFVLPWIDGSIFAPQPPAGAPKLPHHAPHTGGHFLKMLQFTVRDLILFILTIGVSIASKLTYKWRIWDSQQKEILAKQKEIELTNLKNQLNPHFLFNTLNNIYSLIAISPQKAQNAVHELSKMLRYILYDSPMGNFTTIEKEIDFISNYLELMRLRLTSSVNVSFSTEVADKNVGIAPLLFIPLIENAFKHGVIHSKNSFVDIKIIANDCDVQCIVTNSYFPKQSDSKSGKTGIGLENLKRQLQILYPDCSTLQSYVEGDTYTARLTIKVTAPKGGINI